MAPKNRQSDDDRARRTLYVTGFNAKLIKKHLLKELFSQGGPVIDVTLFETHAYILFQHEESVPYCLALFNNIEMFGDTLRLKPRSRSAGNPYTYLDYLTEVRCKLREEYSKVKPPSLPAKKYSNEKTHRRNRGKRRSNNSAKDIQNKEASGAQAKPKSPVSSKIRRSNGENNSDSKATPNAISRKRGGKRSSTGSRKVQKKIKYLV